MTASILVLASFLVAIAPVVSILAIRNCVRSQRNAIIEQLNTAFANAHVDSWEFVKSKYRAPQQGMFAWIGDLIQWTAAAIPLIATNWALAAFTIATIAQSRFGVGDAVDGFVLASPQPFRWVIVTGFCAAFLNLCANLLRSVKNFDFNPITFLDATVDIALGVFVGLVFYFAYGLFKTSIVPPEFATSADSIKVSLSMLLAFAASYYPDVVKRYIVRVSNLNYVKVEKAWTFTGLELIPVEVIDGVDSTIRKRLEDYHIFAVENLAVANPLMLFVETPYGLYALVDWVAQAQVFAAFGVKRAGALLDLGVRSLIDLDAYADHPEQHGPMLKALGAVLLKSVPAEAAEANALVVDMLVAALATPSVRRLRQLTRALSTPPAGAAPRAALHEVAPAAGPAQAAE